MTFPNTFRNCATCLTACTLLAIALLASEAIAQDANATTAEKATTDNALTEAEVKAGYKLLFNGHDFTGWVANRNGRSNHCKWIVEDGTIGLCLFGGKAKYVPSMMLQTKDEYENYILKFDYKTGKSTHSGVVLRAPEPKRINQTGFEINIRHPAKVLNKYATGAFTHDIKSPTKYAQKEAGEWNQMVITMQHPNVTVELNGEIINEIDLSKYTEAGKRPDGTEHRATGIVLSEMPRKGIIRFRDDHGSPFWLKNIKLKPLE